MLKAKVVKLQSFQNVDGEYHEYQAFLLKDSYLFKNFLFEDSENRSASKAESMVVDIEDTGAQKGMPMSTTSFEAPNLDPGAQYSELEQVDKEECPDPFLLRVDQFSSKVMKKYLKTQNHPQRVCREMRELKDANAKQEDKNARLRARVKAMFEYYQSHRTPEQKVQREVRELKDENATLNANLKEFDGGSQESPFDFSLSAPRQEGEK